MEGERLSGTVFIVELLDPKEQFTLTGLFAGHLEGDDDLADEFEDLPADEAIAWGRERAGVVLIRTGDSDYYSAGVENPEQLPEWPLSAAPLGRRRVRGFEALDNTEDDTPVLWDVRVEAKSPGLGRIKPFRDAVRSHPMTREVQLPRRDTGGHRPRSWSRRSPSSRRVRSRMKSSSTVCEHSDPDFPGGARSAW